MKKVNAMNHLYELCSCCCDGNREKATDSEVCHPRCVFKLYGEVNSVKNTTVNIWLNDGVY